MLLEMAIRNYALIDSLSLTFDEGFTVLTGETGAGKSIIVGALSFILGAKANTDLIRTGADEAQVSAVVSISPANKEARAWLSERDITPDDDKLFVRRVLKSNGRVSQYIQNIPQTQGALTECMALLFDLHGQHAHESLLRADTHRQYLDNFAGLTDDVRLYNGVFVRLAETKKQLDNAQRSDAEREERENILRYAVDEIKDARLKPGEMRELKEESERLAAFERLQEMFDEACAAFFDGEASLLGSARRANQALEMSSSIDGALAAVQKRVSDLYYEAEDIADELKLYRRDLTFDPDRLEFVEFRLSRLQKLRKKYGTANAKDDDYNAEDAILSYAASAEEEIAGLSGLEEKRESLAAEIKTLEKEIFTRGVRLTEERTKAAAVLGGKIETILRSLGMADARFSVSLEAKGDGKRVFGPWGQDDINFIFSANKGEPLKELARIASGGELSRVMLAIKSALSVGAERDGRDSIETLVFDEIDTGIGGETAQSVAKYLAALGDVKQLFCITHLAVIASRASHHFKVEKSSAGERTHTTLRLLEGDERKTEIARMLSGSEGGTALKHAEELLGKGGGLF